MPVDAPDGTAARKRPTLLSTGSVAGNMSHSILKYYLSRYTGRLRQWDYRGSRRSEGDAEQESIVGDRSTTIPGGRGFW